MGILMVLVLAVDPSQAESGDSAFARRLIAAAIAQTTQRVVYDGSYRAIPYPGGDVPVEIGVCTDVIIGAYRAVGIDLQRRVHEDKDHQDEG